MNMRSWKKDETKNQQSMDRQALEGDEEACSGRRMGTEKIVRQLGGLMKRNAEDVTKKKAQKSTDCIAAREGKKSETRSHKSWANGSNGPTSGNR